MLINIENYRDDDTVFSIKQGLLEEKNKEEEKQRVYTDFLKSFEGEYVFCKHNQKTGFVCQLQKDWWWKQSNKLLFINPDGIRIEHLPINPLWIKSNQPNSIDIIRKITKEQYEQVVKTLQSIQELTTTQHDFLWTL